VILRDIINLYIWAFIAYALMSWIPPTQNPVISGIRGFLSTICEPVLRPLRRVLPRPQFGGLGLDLSVLVAVLLLEILATFL
jgi:YggT family protein